MPGQKSESSFGRIWGIYSQFFCITYYYKLDQLKQHMFITLQFLWFEESGHSFTGSSAQCLIGLQSTCHLGWSLIWRINWRIIFLQAHSGCWQNLIPYSCITEGPAFWWFSTGAHFQILEASQFHWPSHCMAADFFMSAGKSFSL